jgi:hypothetical protein
MGILILIILGLWLLGIGVGYTVGGLVNLLIVIAVVLILVKLIRGGTWGWTNW